MEDKQIISLYWERSENAISATADKYGPYCHTIAFNILHDYEDSEECVNDTYLNAWNTIPPHRPGKLRAFLRKITRNLALNRWAQYHADKRGHGQVPLVLDELQECVPASGEQAADELALMEILNRFLGSLPVERRKIFMRRYWYMDTIQRNCRELFYGRERGENGAAALPERAETTVGEGGLQFMKEKRLLDALGQVDSIYIEEAASQHIRRPGWAKWGGDGGLYCGCYCFWDRNIAGCAPHRRCYSGRWEPNRLCKI